MTAGCHFSLVCGEGAQRDYLLGTLHMKGAVMREGLRKAAFEASTHYAQVIGGCAGCVGGGPRARAPGPRAGLLQCDARPASALPAPARGRGRPGPRAGLRAAAVRRPPCVCTPCTRAALQTQHPLAPPPPRAAGAADGAVAAHTHALPARGAVVP